MTKNNKFEEYLKENEYPFENFLKSIHADKYPDSVLDDDMPDHFDQWLENLEIEQWIHYGNIFGDLLLLSKTK